jgi:hypothetical protein
MILMGTPFIIEKMTIEEKLQAMEALWDDLCRHEADILVQQWQKDILDERERLVTDGRSQFIDWEQAKKDIARETS